MANDILSPDFQGRHAANRFSALWQKWTQNCVLIQNLTRKKINRPFVIPRLRNGALCEAGGETKIQMQGESRN